MQPKGQIKPFLQDAGVHPAEVFPPNANEESPLSPTAWKTPARTKPWGPRHVTGSSPSRPIAASGAAKRHQTRVPAIPKTTPLPSAAPRRQCSRSWQGSLSLLRSPGCCGMLWASHDTGPGLGSQDTAHRSPEWDLLSDPTLNTSTDGESTALPRDLV